MKCCQVIGKCTSTIKHESLKGHSLLLVHPINQKKNIFIATDYIGCSVGEYVMVTTGSSARKIYGQTESAIDATIVGIIDHYKLEKN